LIVPTADASHHAPHTKSSRNQPSFSGPTILHQQRRPQSWSRCRTRTTRNRYPGLRAYNHHIESKLCSQLLSQPPRRGSVLRSCLNPCSQCPKIDTPWTSAVELCKGSFKRASSCMAPTMNATCFENSVLGTILPVSYGLQVPLDANRRGPLQEKQFSRKITNPQKCLFQTEGKHLPTASNRHGNIRTTGLSESCQLKTEGSSGCSLMTSSRGMTSILSLPK
jgi:hypothetical protein